MSVRRDQRGRWLVDVKLRLIDGTVKRVTRTSESWTRRQAEQWERDARRALVEGTYQSAVDTEPRKEIPTLKLFVDERWWPVYPAAAGNRQTTIRDRRWALDSHLLPELGSRRLDQIDTEAVARLAAGLRGKELSPKTVVGLCSVLRRILACAVDWGVISALPRFPKIKLPEVVFDYFDAEETRRLLAATEGDERALIMFAIRTGVRAGELAALEWGDIDWARHEVIIRRNRPSTTRTVGPTKSGRQRRIPLTAQLEDTLRQARHLRGPLLFCRSCGTPLENWDLRRMLNGACHRAKLRRMTFHGLRHSFASQAVAAGVPLNVVQGWLGHSTIGMTMRYSHFAPADSARWINALDGARADIGQTPWQNWAN